MKIEDLALIASKSNNMERDITEYCEQYLCTPPECLNQLTLHVAENYHTGKYSYEFSDEVVNLVFGHMTDDFILDHTVGNTLPEPAFSIYLAFDSGEYQRRSDADTVCPIKKYTDPEIALILAEYKGT